ncbi:WD40 repeat-like protein [Dichomitus squalens LYAD-421 SS1]|uniref:WD40 repeat-like protein n=1 Tax=Dichomitus squalens (strain LYAD-421) TaxID=732165 RepID=R7SWR6_DICSQ|nr:WD40 repeat-like protein [Dichomitus squalens LYAD-421 SS1]EJF60526.1 WD40 repeat-like protein [Dichomitus squalens LYAD-421 SS1]
MEVCAKLEKALLTYPTHRALLTVPAGCPVLNERKTISWSDELRRCLHPLGKTWAIAEDTRHCEHHPGISILTRTLTCVAGKLGHDSRVTALVVSSDGRWVATASEDSTIILWDARDACISQEWLAHTGKVWDLAFSPDGRHLASAGAERKIAIWDIGGSPRQPSTCLERGELPIIAVFSPSSTHIAVGYTSGTTRVWDLATRGQPLLLPGHEDWVHDVAFSPNGQLLLSAAQDKTIKVWDVHTGSVVHLLEEHEDGVCKACFSPCGKYIASASDDETVRVWRTGDGLCLATLSDHGSRVDYVAFTPDGTMLWSAVRNGTVQGRRLQDVIPNEFKL